MNFFICVRQLTPTRMCDESCIASLFTVLSRYLQSTIQSHDVNSFRIGYPFYDIKIGYSDCNRLGGIITHLVKNNPVNAVNSNISPSQNNVLFDLMIWFYHFSMAIRYRTAMLHLQNIQNAISQLEEIDKKMKNADAVRFFFSFWGLRLLISIFCFVHILKQQDQLHLTRARTHCVEDICFHVRLSTASQVYLFSKVKQELAFDMCHYIAKVCAKRTTKNTNKRDHQKKKNNNNKITKRE